MFFVVSLFLVEKMYLPLDLILIIEPSIRRPIAQKKVLISVARSLDIQLLIVSDAFLRVGKCYGHPKPRQVVVDVIEQTGGLVYLVGSWLRQWVRLRVKPGMDWSWGIH